MVTDRAGWPVKHRRAISASYEIRRVLTDSQGDDLIGQPVEDRPADLTDPGVYYDADTNQPVLLYAPYSGDLSRLRNAVMAINFQTVGRTGMGWKNAARTFGMAPRKPLQQREACQPTALWREQPSVHRVLEEAAAACQSQLDSYLPEIVEADRSNIGQVLPEWRLDDESVWTSGIVNKTSALPYHRDEMNFHAWSAMPVVRRHCDGGRLHIPEYDRTIGCRDGWVIYFMGKTLIHGNTPVRTTRPDGYRISVVYYALRGMKDCYTYAAELAHAREKRTVREQIMDAAQ